MGNINLLNTGDDKLDLSTPYGKHKRPQNSIVLMLTGSFYSLWET